MSETARMRKKSPLLSTLAVLAVLAGVRKTKAAAGGTAQHFKILCRLAEIAKAPLKKFELPDFNPEEIYEAARRRAVDFGGKNETAIQDKGEGKTETQEGEGISLEDVLKEAKEPKKYSKFRSSSELRQLALIVDKMKALKDDVEKTKNEIGTKEKAIRLDLARAIYGRDAAEVDFKKAGNKGTVDFKTEDDAVGLIVADANLAGKTISGSKSTSSCEGSDSHLAVSIVNDLYCVCASSSSTTDGTCHHGVQYGSADAWGKLQKPSGATDKHETAKALLAECAKVVGNVSLSAHAIQAGLATFFSKIGAGTTHAQAHYLFGITSNAASTPCSASDANTACVDYGHFLSKGDKQNQIPWVKKLQEAEENLEKRTELIQKLHRDAGRLHDLALVAQMIQRPTAVGIAPFAPTGLPADGAKGKLTHQGQENVATVSETSASGAFAPAIISHFILLWTLFI